MNYNYLSLRYFLEIARCLNFSRAAKNLHISQPGLSQQITTLEKEFGFKLLHRSSRSVKLTEEGNYLYKNLLPSFENIEKTLSELKETGAVPQKTIRIATVPSAASHFVPLLIKELKEKYPNIEFYMKETTSVHSIELVKKRACDLALIRTPIDIKQRVQEPLKWMEFQKHPILAAVSHQHRMANEKTIDLYELRNETYLHYDAKSSPSLYYLLEYACLSSGFIPKTIGAGPEFLTRANLISSGIGITLLPEDMLQLFTPHKIKGIYLKNLSLSSSISVVWNGMNVPIITEDALHILERFKHTVAATANKV